MAPVMLTPVLKIYLISEWSKDIYEVKKIHLFHKTSSYRTMHFTYQAPHAAWFRFAIVSRTESARNRKMTTVFSRQYLRNCSTSDISNFGYIHLI